MKKFISLLCIFLFLSLSINSIYPLAEPVSTSKTLSQGFYNIRDTNLLTGSSYNVENTSPANKCILMILDGNLQIQELIRLEPNSSKYCLRPFQSDYTIVIIGNATLILS